MADRSVAAVEKVVETGDMSVALGEKSAAGVTTIQVEDAAKPKSAV